MRLRFFISLIASIIAIQAITLSLVVWNDLTRYHERYRAQLQNSLEQQGKLLAEILAPKLLNAADQSVLTTLELLKSDPDWRYAGVFNNRRELIASLGEPPPLTQSLTSDFSFRYQASADLTALEQPIAQNGATLGILVLGYSTRDKAADLIAVSSQSGILAATGFVLAAAMLVALSVLFKNGLKKVHAALRTLQAGDWNHRIEFTTSNPIAPIANDVNRLATYMQISQSELRNRYDHLLQETRRLNSLLHGINVVVWEVDPQSGHFTYVSEEAERLLGYPVTDWLEPDFCRQHVDTNDLYWLQEFLRNPGTNPEPYSMDFRIYNSTDQCLWLRMISSVEFQDQGPVLVGLLLNVTEEKQSEQHIAYLANFDPLTGLINRNRFQQKLGEAIDESLKNKENGALLFLDLDQFKYINDAAGHHTGDEYLRQVANHLRDNLDSNAIIGRLGGDEFGIILDNIKSEQTKETANKVLSALNSQEFRYEDLHMPLSASIGIALFPEHGDQAGELLAKADSAMYYAKDQGRNTCHIFEEDSDAARIEEKIYWEEKIRRSIRNNRFRLFFQPIVELETGIIRHYESLLRMIGDEGEIISPSAFIGIAERFGMIRDIDHWVVTNAIRIQGLNNQAGKPVSLTINLSGRHFGSSEILEVIEKATQDARAVPEKIIFEVTETAAVENFSEACNFIQALHARGYRFALDDFGSGFSSFDYLKHIPVDYVKIDGSFVRNLARDRVDRVFVSTISEMARNLKVQTVAEFVENRDTVEVLKELQVSLGQGYFFAKPAPRFHEHERVVVPIA